MTAWLAEAWLHGCGLPQAWAGRNAFQILDTSYGDGQRWREILAAWRADPARPSMLHCVALQAPSDPSDPSTSGPAAGTAEAERQEFDSGAVLLTRMSGDLAAGLRALRMNADLLLCLPDSSGDIAASARLNLSPWTAKLLARCCQRGARLFSEGLPDASKLALVQQGFEAQPAPGDGYWLSQYNPHWEPKGSRQTGGIGHAQAAEGQPRRCVVVGAGLAGASAAYALARRGWAVQVLDAAFASAQGASSLPLGLMAPHTSADDSLRSRLTRAGVRMTTSQASRLLTQREDWDNSGLLTLKPDAAPHFQTQGAWIKPQALVHAWLAHPGITFRAGAEVVALQWQGAADVADAGEWRVLAAGGELLGQAPLVILAAAGGCRQLLQNVQSVQSVQSAQNLPHWPGQTPTSPSNFVALAFPPFSHPRLTDVPGQVSWGRHQPDDGAWAPAFSVNGHGYLATNVPVNGERVWLTGATFEDEAHPLTIAQAHDENFSRLQQLLPGAAAALQRRFDGGQVNSWRQVRCTTADRLPICGPVGAPAPGLWLNTGFGARGLTWSVLCAELLAARVNHEPWPVAARLAAKLDYRV